MARHSYRAGFERLKADLAAAQRLAGDPEAMDRACRALDAFVAAIVSDPRKLRWVAEESPACAAEIEAWAEGVALPCRVLDPVHDGAYARLWAASLGDADLGMLRHVLQAEAVRRQPARR